MLSNLKPSMLLVISSILFSCAYSDDSSATFKALSEGITNSTRTINSQTQTIYASAKEKTMDPLTEYRANVWEPKLNILRQKTSNVISHISELTKQIKNENGLDESTLKGFKNVPIDSSFNKIKAGKEIFDAITKYKKKVLQIDPLIQQEFAGKLNFIPLANDSITSGDAFSKLYFQNASVYETLAVLCQIENNVRLAENRVANFCHFQIPSYSDDFTSYSAIFNMSSSYVKPGDNIEVTAGMVEYSRRNKPSVIINGKIIGLEEDGAAHYKFKAPSKTGKHHLPVSVKYIDQDGKEQTLLKNMEYNVVKDIIE